MMNKKYFPIVVYGAVALTVLAPLLMPGFVVTLDMVFTPELPMPTEISNTYAFFALLHWLNVIIPADILQKVILAAILLLSGIGAHRLFLSIQSLPQTAISPWLPYVAGLFYMINPFVYSRFMAGQFLVLLGYALLPFVARFAWQFAEQPRKMTIFRLILGVLAVSLVSIHAIGFVAVLVGLAAIIHLVRNPRDIGFIRRLLLCSGAGVGILTLLSSYWLIPLVRGTGKTAEVIADFDAADHAAFATLGQSFVEKFGNVLQLQGFWVEGAELFSLPQSRMPLWGVIMIVWWVMVLVGLWYLWRHRRPQAWWWGLILSTSILLATGAAQGILQHLPLANGYREPQKFVALVALSYAVLGTIGVGAIATKLARQRLEYAQITIITGLIAPPLLAITMFGGFGGQLRPTTYPTEWQAVNALLSQDTPAAKTLFLPWHLYMHFEFADRIIANPAPQFFATPIVSSTNPEIGGVGTPASDTVQRTIESTILPAGPHADIGTQLAGLGIKYVIVAKEYDYEKYNYLDNHQDLTVVYDSETMKLYRNNAFKELVQ